MKVTELVEQLEARQTDSRVVRTPGVCGGRPRIAGTRMAVDVMLGMLSSGDDLEFLLTEFPELSREDWLAAISYAQKLVSEVPPAMPQAA